MKRQILLARAYAMSAHGAINQRRAYTGVPYIVHPAAVARTVASVTDDTGLIQAAWLHDVVEDTNTTVADIQQVFGDDVAELVRSVTNVSKRTDGNRAARKAIDKAHLSRASARAQTLKLADILDNTRGIARLDPAFATVYIREKLDVLEILRDGDSGLFQAALEQLKAAQAALA